LTEKKKIDDVGEITSQLTSKTFKELGICDELV
jgi:hypothetical protein